MCTVSMVVDSVTSPLSPNYVQPWRWNTDSFSELQQVLEAVKRLDEKLGQRDCIDPEKAKKLEAIERRVRALEAKEKKMPRKKKTKPKKKALY